MTKKGFVFIEDSMKMFLDLETKLASKQQDNILIFKMDSNLKTWIAPLQEAYQATPEITLQYQEAHQRALEKQVNFQHFSLFKEDQPVCSLTLSVHNQKARLDDIGTTSSYQRQGFATLLVEFALQQAKTQGATHCFLESSSTGLSVYEKIGFKRLEKNFIYSAVS